MSSWLLRLIILACTAVHLLGCAERYRNADAGRTATEVEAFYRENIQGKVATVGDGLSAASLMLDDPTTNVYYAESYRDPGGTMAPMGPIEAVTPVDFLALGLGITEFEIQTIRVYFMDQVSPEGRYNHALVMYITTLGASSQPLIFAVANTSDAQGEPSSVDDDGIFEVSFPLAGKRLLLRSDDTTEGELNDVVQFGLSIDDGVSEPVDAGQISSMVGFISKN